MIKTETFVDKMLNLGIDLAEALKIASKLDLEKPEDVFMVNLGSPCVHDGFIEVDENAITVEFVQNAINGSVHLDYVSKIRLALKSATEEELMITQVATNQLDILRNSLRYTLNEDLEVGLFDGHVGIRYLF